ncbi:MAG: ATP-binding protein, partial [Myxococcales bacterium]
VAEALRAQLAARERVRAVRRPLEVGPDAFAAAVATLRAEPGEAALLIVDGARFTPATLRAVEELARFTGAALDNLREKQRLVAKLSALRQAQQNLLAEERLSVLGEAAAILAHEIRNPLGAVANGLSLLRRSTPEQEGLLGIMGDEIARLDALTHDLLQLARPLEPRRQLVDLERLVRATVERLRAGRDDVRYLVDARARVRVHADPALLQLALENLLRNAAQASPARGEVRIIVSDASGATSVVVEDQGPGIDAVDRLRIFEPFFTTRASGTGLGLPIVKRIVQAHGGEVRVGGGAGGGARFEMLLSAHLE